MGGKKINNPLRRVNDGFALARCVAMPPAGFIPPERCWATRPAAPPPRAGGFLLRRLV